MTRTLKTQAGFTLIEIMATLVIVGILASVAIKKTNDYSDLADRRVIEQGLATLNAYEVDEWVRVKFSETGFTDDTVVFSAVNTDLGGEYVWTAGPTQDGGSLRFNQTTLPVSRVRSTYTNWGRWTL